uniref:Purple acid phosphatase n=2 Tax=Sarcoptes scabiei TaxID=52283 RepID=A0A834VHS0_SARSC
MFCRNFIIYFILLEIVSLFYVYLCSFSNKPEQVHLSLGYDPSQMYVTWISHRRTPYEGSALVRYGFNRYNLSLIAFGRTTRFTTNYTRYVHRVLLINLRSNSHYYYRCGWSNGLFSETFKFKTLPIDQENHPVKIAVYGDLGFKNGVSIPYLTQQVSENTYDAIFHTGDIAYDLHFEDGHIGDSFMQALEPVAANVPYQVVVGNHEDDGFNFTDYRYRFTMADETSGQINNLFYSFHIGSALVIGFSSEFYYFTNYGLKQIENQYRWLEEVLSEANKPENRCRFPWIIAMCHRPMYCSSRDDDDCTNADTILRKGIPIVNRYGLEDLFYKYGVDIIFAGHEHNYERMFPVFNRTVMEGSSSLNPYDKPEAPVHFVVGAAGNDEFIDPFILKRYPWSAKRIFNYGITEMVILNKTNIRIRQRDTTKNGDVVDSIEIIKGRFGLFN